MHPSPVVTRPTAPTESPRSSVDSEWSARLTALLVVVAAAAALGACAVALLMGGGLPVAMPDGIADAGAFTGWGLRVSSLLANLAAVLTIGALLVGVVLLPAPADRTGAFDALAARAVVLAGRWAAAWAVLGVVVLVLTVSDTAGVPLGELSPELLVSISSTDHGQALVMTILMSAAVAGSATRGSTLGGRRALLLVALAALLPATVTGHASSGVDPDVATSGLVVHVLAATVWVGGLGGVLLLLRKVPAALAAAVPRFSLLAITAYCALAVSGLLTATTRLDNSVSAWTSGYGAIVVAKAVALMVLGILGHLHRRRALPRLAAGGTKAFLDLAVIELVVMGAAMGMAAALARTPVPLAPVVSGPSHGLGHSTLPSAVDPVSLTELATAWRWNALALVVLGVVLAVYLVGVRSLARRGRRWPVTRSTAFVAGLLLALVDLCSGVATYASAMVSVQIAQFLVALLFVPLLLALGAPLTLWLRVRHLETEGQPPAVLQSRALRAFASPVVSAMAVCALLLGLYRTPLIEVSLRSFWMHLFVLGLAVVLGLVFLWPVLAVDPVPAPTGFIERASCLAAVLGCLLLLAHELRRSDRLLAGEWFLELRWGWVDPAADQRLGGALVVAAATAMLVLLALAVTSGSRRGGSPESAQPVTGQTLNSTRPRRSSSATAP